MSIKDFALKIKPFGISAKNRASDSLKSFKIDNDIFIVLLIILTGTASFGLGKLSALEKQKVPISILKTKGAMYESLAVNPSSNSAGEGNQASTNTEKGIVLASKSGTKYYYPECSGVSRIKEENKIWFATVAEAELSGLTLAANCTP